MAHFHITKLNKNICVSSALCGGLYVVLYVEVNIEGGLQFISAHVNCELPLNLMGIPKRFSACPVIKNRCLREQLLIKNHSLFFVNRFIALKGQDVVSSSNLRPFGSEIRLQYSHVLSYCFSETYLWLNAKQLQGDLLIFLISLLLK